MMTPRQPLPHRFFNGAGLNKIIKISLSIAGILLLLVIAKIWIHGISEKRSHKIRVAHYETYMAKIGSHNEDISIIVDFSIPSSDPRFLVYDNRQHLMISLSKCAHGAGGESTVSKPVFSNTPGSECSSLSTFRLTRNDKLHNSGFNRIRLEGLDGTNSNAASRGIVIHEGPFCRRHIHRNTDSYISLYQSRVLHYILSHV